MVRVQGGGIPSGLALRTLCLDPRIPHMSESCPRLCSGREGPLVLEVHARDPEPQ